jgi:hypothetical protein
MEENRAVLEIVKRMIFPLPFPASGLAWTHAHVQARCTFTLAHIGWRGSQDRNPFIWL